MIERDLVLMLLGFLVAVLVRIAQAVTAQVRRPRRQRQPGTWHPQPHIDGRDGESFR